MVEINMTITIQIGNTDDKLTQEEWARYVEKVNEAIQRRVFSVYFFGAPVNYAKWQNAAWVIECKEEDSKFLMGSLIEIREHFRQDSVAWTEGRTFFI